MDSQDDKNFIDADYKNAESNDNIDKSNTKYTIINGEPLFYTTTQVSQMVGVEPSTIRFWGKRFERLLDVEFSNKSKQYKKSDVEKLKFIKKLTKEDGLTLQQVEDYCSSKGFDINEIEKQVLDTSNPLAIQAFISAATVEMDKKLNAFSENLLNTIDNKLKNYIILQAEENVKVAEKLKEDVVITVDEVVSEKLTENSKEIKFHIDQSTEVTNQLNQENKKILEELAVSIAEIKERDKKIAELLDDPEAFEKTKKKIKNEEDRFFSKIAKKVFGK